MDVISEVVGQQRRCQLLARGNPNDWRHLNIDDVIASVIPEWTSRLVSILAEGNRRRGNKVHEPKEPVHIGRARAIDQTDTDLANGSTAFPFDDCSRERVRGRARFTCRCRR
jgi:hypothetical protein